MTASRPWFILAGGGTGGHLYPGLAVAEALQGLQPDIEISVFGTPRDIDETLTDARGYELIAQEVRPLTGRPWRWPAFVRAWDRSVRRARRRFEERAPIAVLGLGGYAAGPAVVAASRLGVATAIFNPDATPGRANRLLARRVRRVFVQWPETIGRFRGGDHLQCTGCPIRAAFARAKAKPGHPTLDLDPTRRTLLITGASQGARSINAAIMELFDVWRTARQWQIIHLTGPADSAGCRARYQEHGIDARTLPFTEQMADYMAAADLVISRAGASTLAEITAMALPSILMPYPFDRRQHQRANADVLVRQGAAVMVEDRIDPTTNADRLRNVLRDLMGSDERRQRMSGCAGALGRTDAAQIIARELLEIAHRNA